MPDTEECLCEECESEIDDVNVESWETTGKFLCADCAESAFEEAAARAEWESDRASRADLAAMREAYDISDPKHPDFAETMAARADAARKERQ